MKKPPVLLRLTLVKDVTGDVLYEQVWSWSLPTTLPLQPPPPSSQTSEETARQLHRTEAVSSMMQVLHQLSRELSHPGVSLVRFGPVRQSLGQPSQSLATPLGVGSRMSLALSPSSLSIDGRADHVRARTGRNNPSSLMLSPSSAADTVSLNKDTILIEYTAGCLIGGVFVEVEDNVDYLMADHFGSEGRAYRVIRNFLKGVVERFAEDFSAAIDALPAMVKEKRKPADEQAVNAFVSTVAASGFPGFVRDQYQLALVDIEKAATIDGKRAAKLEMLASSVLSTTSPAPSDSTRGTPQRLFDTIDSKLTRISNEEERTAQAGSSSIGASSPSALRNVGQ